LQNNAVVKRYGYALFAVYKELSQSELIRDVFRQFIELLEKHKELYVILISPVIRSDEKIGLLEDLVKKIRYEEKFLNF